MKPKPSHLSLKYAEQFKDHSIVEVYHHREPYVQETIQKLAELITDEPRVLLDVGCGIGDLARVLVTEIEDVERVDAVDFSKPMLDKGRLLPAGNDPRLNWIYGRVEEVKLQPPYALITAGDSVHWMEWDIVFPLFHRSLTPHGYVALVSRASVDHPWDEELGALCARYSTNQEYAPYNPIEELEERHLFELHGSFQAQPVPLVQSGEDHLRCLHSRNGLSYERMSQQVAKEFDEAIRLAISPFLHKGQLILTVLNTVQWGKPLAPNQE
jgi:SAM-dependent methyltransferase